MNMKTESDPEKGKPQEFYRHEYAIPFDESILSKSNLEIIQYLKENTILFREISDNLVEQLVPLSAIEKYTKGEKILEENALNNRIFFLMRGTIGIYKQGEHILKLQRKGDIFGEMSLISDKPTSAVVLAESDVNVFSINVKGIEEYTNIDEKTIKDTLYKLYAVILADKLAMTTFKAIGLERKVKGRTQDLEYNNLKLNLAKEEAERANEAKSLFLSKVTHELRTPMHHIIGYSQIGAKFHEVEPKKVHNAFTNIINSSNTMMAFIDDLLDLSEMDAGRMKYTFSENDISMLFQEKLTGFSSQIEKKNIAIVIEESDVSTVTCCDLLRISQVIHNLLANAIELTPRNRSIRVFFESAGAPSKKQLLVSVADEGPGIPEDELDNIFNKFAQSSITISTGGTGIGLAICREIVTAHQGKIWAENQPEGGAVFRFKLPYKQGG